MPFKVDFKTRWSDFDANKHMRHTAYNDYAAETRLRFFNTHNVTTALFEKINIGPILFSENTIFRKEIRMNEDLSVSLFLQASSTNGERFKMLHYIYNEKGEIAAEILIYAAWLDLKTRKLTLPAKTISNSLTKLTKTSDFEIIKLKNTEI